MTAALLKRIFLTAGIAALAAGCSARARDLPTPVSGGLQAAAYMPAGQDVAPPYGFIGFCLRHETACEGGTDAPLNIVLTPSRWDELTEINEYVNRRPEVTDRARYGVDEFWTYADAMGGDCEDLALEKRRLLIARGWPADGLLLATASTWSGEGHAVLLVETDRGELVLDNKNWAIVASRDAPYLWQARQSRRRPYIWVDLDRRTFRRVATVSPALGAPAPFIAAARTAADTPGPRTSFSGLDELGLDPHVDIVADGRPPGR